MFFYVTFVSLVGFESKYNFSWCKIKTLNLNTVELHYSIILAITQWLN